MFINIKMNITSKTHLLFILLGLRLIAYFYYKDGDRLILLFLKISPL